MNDFFRNALGKMDGKMKTRIVSMLAAGVLLIICANTFFPGNQPTVFTGSKQEEPGNTDVRSVAAKDAAQSYEQTLEQRLKSIYEKVEGAGSVSVMLTLSYGKEIVVAEDITSQQSSTKEADGQLVSREQSEINTQGKKIIISGESGSDKPLILKEIEPKVEGVVIVCEGGDDIIVADALIRATQTVLGVEPHKVQVLKMKKMN